MCASDALQASLQSVKFPCQDVFTHTTPGKFYKTREIKSSVMLLVLTLLALFKRWCLTALPLLLCERFTVFFQLGTHPLLKAVMMLFFPLQSVVWGEDWIARAWMQWWVYKSCWEDGNSGRENLQGVVLWGVIIVVIQSVGCKWNVSPWIFLCLVGGDQGIQVKAGLR